MIFDRISIPLWKVTTSFMLLSLCAPLAHAAEAVPDEVLVTTEYIFDPEFDLDAPRYAWTNPMTGDVFVGDPHKNAESGLLLIEDEALQLEEDCVDVIIGEVKQGSAEFNPGLKDHRVLHSVLRRIDWIYVDHLNDVVTGLQQEGVHYAGARGGGSVRTRLVAFGRDDETSLNTITHTHIVQTLTRFFSEFDDAFRPVQFKDPATAMLRLLQKTGFDVHKHEGGSG